MIPPDIPVGSSWSKTIERGGRPTSIPISRRPCVGRCGGQRAKRDQCPTPSHGQTSCRRELRARTRRHSRTLAMRHARRPSRQSPRCALRESRGGIGRARSSVTKNRIRTPPNPNLRPPAAMPHSDRGDRTAHDRDRARRPAGAMCARQNESGERARNLREFRPVSTRAQAA